MRKEKRRYSERVNKLRPISEGDKIRGVPQGVRYGSVSTLQIDITPATSGSALEANGGIIKLAVSHM